MILIFGGAYQGKLGYARDYFKDKFDIGTVFDCREVKEQTGSSVDRSPGRGSDADLIRTPDSDTGLTCAPDFDADLICGIEAFVNECERAGIEAADWFARRRDRWQNKILIIRDQSQGIVPVDAHLRAAREMNGRLMIYLAGEAEEVHRVFCGIGKRIK